MPTTAHKLISETIGTALLLIAIIGSGAGVDQLAEGLPALALLIHALVVGGALVALIIAFDGTSAHFNPAVTLFFVMRGELPRAQLPLFWLAQVCGAIIGAVLTHVMFELPLIELGTNPRTGMALWVSEAFATFSLVIIIAGSARQNLVAVALAVGAFIGGAIWCFSSAAFANPAVSIARCLTNSYTAIRPVDVLPFCLAQFAGAAAACAVPGFGQPSSQDQSETPA